MIVCFFDTVKVARADCFETTFAELVEMLEIGVTTDQHRSDKEITPSFVPALFDPPTRALANVQARYAFTGDADGLPGDPGFDGMRELLDGLGFAYCIYTTTKSTDATNRYRVVLPLSEPVSAARYGELCASINLMLGGVFDTSTFDASRLSILPQRWYGAPLTKKGKPEPDWDDADGHHAFAANVIGPAIDAETIIEAFPPPPKPVVKAPPTNYTAPVGKTDYDFFELSDLNRSPIVPPKAIDTYRSSAEGGRLYSFMCSVALCALGKGYEPDAQVIAALGAEINRTSAGAKTRPNITREAQRAIDFARAKHAASTWETQSEREQQLEARLRNRMKRYNFQQQ